MYPLLVLIHVFLDNARYHHAKIVQEWLAQPGRRVTLHFIPAYCPHLNPIERLWGLMPNKTYATYREFAEVALDFLRKKSPQMLARILQFGHRQFPRHQPKGFSGSGVTGV